MRRLCLAVALAALAGCGGGAGSDRSDDATGSAPPPAAAPSEEAPPSVGGGAAAPEPPDRVGIRLSKACKAVQKKLEQAPEPTGPGGAAANADTERDVLVVLGEKLAVFKIDAQRAAALREYLAVLGHEIEVDELIVKAGTAKDQAAVDDLNEQNGHNRRKRRELADQALAAQGCRPGTRITD